MLGLQLWLELCDLITRHPREVAALKVDAILRSGIRKFTDEARAPHSLSHAQHTAPQQSHSPCAWCMLQGVTVSSQCGALCLGAAGSDLGCAHVNSEV